MGKESVLMSWFIAFHLYSSTIKTCRTSPPFLVTKSSLVCQGLNLLDYRSFLVTLLNKEAAESIIKCLLPDYFAIPLLQYEDI